LESAKNLEYLYINCYNLGGTKDSMTVSEAHIDAVEKVTRRGLIDELERVINSLQESYLDVCFG